MDVDGMTSQSNSWMGPEVFEAIPVATMVVDGEGKVIAWNSAMRDLTGRDSSEVLGKKSWVGLFPKRRATPLDDAIAAGESVEQKLSIGLESQNRVVCRARPLKLGPDGALGAIATILSDTGAGDLDRLAGAIQSVVQSQASGDTNKLIADQDFEGSAHQIAESFNAAITSHWEIIRKLTDILGCYADGNFGAQPAVQANRGLIDDRMEQLRGNWVALVEEANRLSQATAQGRLSERADLTRYKGDYLKVAQGFNALADSLVVPLTLATANLGRIAKGDTPPKITEEYVGDFSQLKENLNACVDSISTLVDQTGVIIRAAREGQLSLRADPDKATGVYRKIIRGMNDALDAVRAPLDVAAQYVDRIAKGDIPLKITEEYKGDFNLIKNNLNACIEVVCTLVAETAVIIRAAENGELSCRANADKTTGVYRKILQGMNRTLDAVVGPLTVAETYIERIAKGDTPPKITEEYRGDFNQIRNNLNTCIDAISTLVDETGVIIRAARDGSLKTRANPDKATGVYRKILRGMNDAIDALTGPLLVAEVYIDRIAKGDTPPKIADEYKGDFNQIKNSLNMCIDAIGTLVGETGVIIRAAREGDLKTRANPDKTMGVYRKILRGMNDALDAVINPLTVAESYIDRIAKGDTPPKITEEYKGDFNQIKENLNTCIDAISILVEETGVIIRGTRDGNLGARGNADRVRGVYRKILRGMNDAIDALTSPLNVAAVYVDMIAKGDLPDLITDEYKGDFNQIKDNLNTCISTIRSLVEDTGMLSTAALEGRLSTRADAARHQGEYRTIVLGINSTLDALIDPIRRSSAALERVARRDLTARVVGEFRGDHAKITHAVNATAEALQSALAEVVEAVDQISAASEHISAGSQSVARGASQQAAALEQTSSSMEEMSGMTQQNADNTQQAKVLAESTKNVAHKGTSAMGQMVDAMSQIHAAAESTASIIRDINDIAFQTNLLALNAAVEAARAGEAGRGFAVVADEVRNLAQRAKEAARKTEELIRQSVKLAERGEGISTDVSENLQEITGSINKVSNIMGEIAAASKEQSRGIEQVNRALLDMDKVTQENAANAQQSSASAEQLASQAQRLREMVDDFQLSTSDQDLLPGRQGLQSKDWRTADHDCESADDDCGKSDDVDASDFNF